MKRDIDIDLAKQFAKGTRKSGIFCKGGNVDDKSYIAALNALAEGIDLSVFFNEDAVKTLSSDDLYNTLNTLYYARLSGVSEKALLKYLRDRKNVSKEEFLKKLNEDIILIEKGVEI